MAKQGLNRQGVIEAAATIADTDGLQNVTFARLAATLSIKPPSLYNHVENLEALLDGLAQLGLQTLLERTHRTAIGLSGFDALKAVASVQRVYAKEHPGLYMATLRNVHSYSAQTQQIAESYLSTVLAILRGYSLEGEKALHAVRCIRSGLQGFIHLEINGGFGMQLDNDISFDTLLQMLDRGLKAL